MTAGFRTAKSVWPYTEGTSCYSIIQSLQTTHHWLEFDEPYMLLPVSLLLERVGSQFYKLHRSLCMADPDPNANPQVPVVWEPACSTVQTVFSYSTVCGDQTLQ